MKRFAKIISFLLTVLLLIFVITACGNRAQDQARDVIRVGVIHMDMPDPTYVNVAMNQANVYEAAGIELVRESTATFDPEGFLNAYQRLVNRGVDAIHVLGMFQNIIPMIQDMCRSAGIYYVVGAREVTAPEVLARLSGCEFYLGNFFADEENTGYLGMMKMAELGVTNVAVIAGPVGDPASDARDRGIARAVRESGINILTTVRELNTAADITRGVETIVTAFPNLGGIFVSYTWAAGAMPALQNVLEASGLAGNIIVGRIDFDESMGEYFEKGQLDFTFGAQMHQESFAAPVVVANQLMETPLFDRPVILPSPYEMLTSIDGTVEYYRYFEGNIPLFSADELNQMFFRFTNPDVTGESVMALFRAFGISDVAARHTRR